MLHRHASPAVAGGYIIGAVTGAHISAFALLIIGGLLTPIPALWRTVIVVALTAVLVLRTLGVFTLRLPQRHFQIDREVFDAEPPLAAARFAFELGLGWRTYVTASAPYAIMLLLTLAAPVALGEALIGTTALALGYGLGRSRVVAAHAFSNQIAVDHPKVWLKVSDLISLITVIAITLRF